MSYTLPIHDLQEVENEEDSDVSSDEEGDEGEDGGEPDIKMEHSGLDYLDFGLSVTLPSRSFHLIRAFWGQMLPDPRQSKAIFLGLRGLLVQDKCKIRLASSKLGEFWRSRCDTSRALAD